MIQRLVQASVQIEKKKAQSALKGVTESLVRQNSSANIDNEKVQPMEKLDKFMITFSIADALDYTYEFNESRVND